MALCMAARAGKPPRRLCILSLTGLLSAIIQNSRGARLETPESSARMRAFAREIHRKLLALGRAAPGAAPLPAIQETEVREDLDFLSLAREFWRRLGPGPEGGMKPARAALALAHGKISRKAPLWLRRLFLKTFSMFPPGSWVRLSSGEVGVVVAPGSKKLTCPLVLSLFAGGERELHLRPPRLVDTCLKQEYRIRAVVRCPIRRCPAPRPLLRVSATV